MRFRRQPPLRRPGGRRKTPHFDLESTMAELAHSEVQLSGEALEASLPRKPFVAPAVEHLGRLEANTLLTVVIP
jgi:hypothetical protein